MTTKEFEELLKQAKLTKKEFAELVKMHYTSVTNWKQDKKNIPAWVGEYLKMYIELQKYKNFKKAYDELVSGTITVK